MIEAVTYAVQAYVALFVLWVLYLAAMNLKPRLKTMQPIARAHGYVLVLIAVVLDALLNWVVASVIFFEQPQELLLTARLKRYHGPAYAGSWRARLAAWICTHLLDPFDPSGKHC